VACCEHGNFKADNRLASKLAMNSESSLCAFASTVPDRAVRSVLTRNGSSGAAATVGDSNTSSALNFPGLYCLAIITVANPQRSRPHCRAPSLPLAVFSCPPDLTAVLNQIRIAKTARRCCMANVTCPDCDSPGNGNCSACHGKGTILGDETFGASTVFGHQSSCTACGGRGCCQTCGGAGEIEVGGEGG